ncbi:MAG: hypothetical protein H7Z38_06290 [Rubrivivax sp.]|nr:hypothetical protein [Pyrinomonadaceae bacterium]
MRTSNATARTIALYGTLAVAAHFAASVLHGLAHVETGVYLGPLGNLFVALVITVAPLVAAALLWTTRARAGALLLAGSMAGSLVFGVYNHFVVVSPDHVLHVPGAEAWRRVFQVSSVLLALSEVAGCIVGVWALGRSQRGFFERSV